MHPLLPLLAAAFLHVPPALAGPADPQAEALRAAVAARAPALLAEHDVPSVSIAYVRDGRLAWTAAFGERAPGEAAAPDTLYNIASMTKPIVAETVLRLAAAGQVALDAPMAPAWVDPDVADDPRHRALTPAMALQHRTGFANWRRETDGVLRFRLDPGSGTGYSGEGYEYVARFAERAVGTPFETLAEQLVLAPSGMRETAFTARPWFAGRLAAPRGPEGEWGEAEAREHWSAADDVRATAADYARFLVAAMAGEGLDEGFARRRLAVVDDQKEQVCRPGRLEGADCPDSIGYGLGWAVLRYPGETVVQHGGSDWGERTIGYYIPERRSGAVILTNGENGMRVIRDVAAILHPDSAVLPLLRLQAR